MADITERDREILEAYAAWEPGEGTSSTALAVELGISRQRLYQVLAKHDVPLKTGRRPAGPAGLTGLGSEALAEAVGQAVLDQLLAARAELAEYRERYGPLE